MIFGVAFIVMAGASDPKLRIVAIYAATGGLDFIIQAWLLGRRRRPATVPTQA